MTLTKFDRENIGSILVDSRKDWFTAQLMRLTGEADLHHRALLARGFPEEVQLVEDYLGRQPVPKGEPEERSHRREDLLVALDELFESDLRSIPPDEWAAAREAFKAAQSELQCPDICDTSCRCYQEGLEAQRERV